MLDKIPDKNKFEARSKENVFVEYARQAKAYWIWISAERQIILASKIAFCNSVNTNGSVQDVNANKIKIEPSTSIFEENV